MNERGVVGQLAGRWRGKSARSIHDMVRHFSQRNERKINPEALAILFLRSDLILALAGKCKNKIGSRHEIRY